MKFLPAVLLLAATVGLAQTKPTEVTVKPTEAQTQLSDLAKGYNTEVKSFNDKLQKAQADLAAKNKPISDKIAPLQKQIDDNNKAAGDAFQKDAGALRDKLQGEVSQIQVLQNVVKKENKLPDNAYYDLPTGKWLVPPAQEKK